MSEERVLLAAMAIALAVTVADGAAQQIGQPNRGLEVAQRLCAECHAIQTSQQRSPNPAAPPFRIIATTPGMTAIALNAALNTPHRSMPNVMLQPDERADLIAYILSLK
jgi:mono/diheme cytochrome c family protein